MVAAIVLIVMPALAVAIPNPTLKWKTLSTEHFDVHFHEGAEWTAQQVAAIAEEVRGPINDVYEYDPGRCNFVILDTDDYANGAAYFYDNKIEIWATNLEFGLRGTTEWLRNVVTHEYTHVVSIQAGMKMPRRIPAVYFQWVNFEDEKRPDVITGYPNAILSYPFVGAVVAPWWAEGVAQYQSPTLQTDCWDTHREMMLRAAVIGDNMLGPVEMGYLGHKSLGNEKVYDHGYGLVRYIADTYGPESIKRISDSLGSAGRLTMDGALKSVTGKKMKELYSDWQMWLQDRYDRQLEPVRANPREGWMFNDEGFMTHSPSYSPDGSKVAFLSNKGSDFSATALHIADADGKNVKSIRRASSRGVFSADGQKLLYARHVRINKYGARVSELYEYDIEKKNDRRITHHARVSEPQYAPDGQHAICVVNGDGTHQIARVRLDGEGEPNVIFEGEKGTQFYAPQYSPDGKRVLMGMFTAGTRDIVSIAADGSDFRYLVRTPNDERDARWLPDGKSIVFASDRTGVFNIYRLDLDDDQVSQLTNVTGGAFTPAPSAADGAVAYAGFNSNGYHVAVLDPSVDPVKTYEPAVYARRAAGEFEECASLKTRDEPIEVASFTLVPSLTATDDDWEASSLASAQGRGVLPRTSSRGTQTAQEIEAKPYERKYTDFQLYPRAVLWDGVLRLGAFITSNEVLDKQSLFASGSYGMDGGFDALVSFQLRYLWPVLYVDYFRFRQKYDDRVQIDDRLYFLDIRYDLWSIDAGLRFEFEDQYSLTLRNDVSLWYSRSEYRVFIDPQYQEAGSDQLFPDFDVGWKYFVGNEFNLEWYFKAIKPALDSDINPRSGRQIRLRAMLAVDDLFTSGEFEYGFNPDFDTNLFGQYTLDWYEFIPLPIPHHTIAFRGMTSFIDANVDDFFWVYMGGLDGIRGYTFYTIGGRAGALASATWRFPVWRRINKQFSWLTLKDIYGGVFFEVANAWDKDGFEFDGYKRAAGYEVRLNMGSFYAYPTTIGLTGAYGLDRAVFNNPLFPENSVVHDPRWRYYFTMGFTF